MGDRWEEGKLFVQLSTLQFLTGSGWFSEGCVLLWQWEGGSKAWYVMKDTGGRRKVK